MLLSIVQRELNWPAVEDIINPPGSGPAVQARLAQEKIGQALSRQIGEGGVRVGVLVADPNSANTEVPVAVVCEFVRPAPESALAEAHRLAWNFCRAPLLITIEPHQLRAWSCFETPKVGKDGLDVSHAEIVGVRGDPSSEVSLALQATRALEWLNLVSGEFFRQHAPRFLSEGRADRTLLTNLRAVRQALISTLSPDIVHDLLARLIFIQFLFDRRDRSGRAALDTSTLRRLHEEGVFLRPHETLDGVLRDYDDAFRFFQWLNERFNGDLFPGKSETTAERLLEWKAEQSQVSAAHLELLANFVSGKLELVSGQYTIWRLYAFDAIPLEFISSIYEEFVQHQGEATGAHYTPLHLVDFVLDAALPWRGEEWDLTVLDPACGSGIFLVKAYQRLVHRWKQANPGQRPPAALLRQLLERNIMGIDSDPHAVRVASFSLYLAMCDEIDPREMWTRVRFPFLRGTRLLVQDFFATESSVATEAEQDAFDIVLGNAPWGKGSATSDAKRWALAADWPVNNEDIGTLFLAKALTIVRPRGVVAMIQPAGTLLFHRWQAAQAFRERLFTSFKVDEVVNFSALRFKLFPASSSPACSIVVRNEPPDGATITYICPKLSFNSDDDYRITIDQYDVNEIHAQEAAEDPYVWTVFMSGGRRDLRLVHRLATEHTSLRRLTEEGRVRAQEGVILNDNDPPHPVLSGRRYLASPTFPEGTGLWLDAKRIPQAAELRVYHRTNPNPEAFSIPQALIKQSFRKETQRFQAVRVVPAEGLGVVPSQSYLSVCTAARDEPILDSLCVAVNSSIAVYFLMMTSSRMAYRTEVLASDLYSLPLPILDRAMLDRVQSQGDVDRQASSAYRLNEVEEILVNDALEYGLAELTRDSQAPGRAPAVVPGDREPRLVIEYCHSVLSSIQASSDSLTDISASIFLTTDTGFDSPVQLVAIQLAGNEGPPVRLISATSTRLQRLLIDLYRRALRPPSGPFLSEKAITYQRVVTVFASIEDGGSIRPVVFILKPNERRYWVRSSALRDSDSIIAAGLEGLVGQGEFPDPSDPTQEMAHA